MSFERFSDGATFEGSVNVCYKQAGNEAVFIGTVDEADGFDVGDQFRISVRDNSPGGSGVPDRTRAQVGAFDPGDCTIDGIFPAVGVVTEGNLTVHQ